MTGTLWRDSTDLESMLQLIQTRVSERKLRLFAAACCRRLLLGLRVPIRPEIELIERYAEGLATLEQLRVVEQAGQGKYEGGWDTAEGVVGYFVGSALEYAGATGEEVDFDPRRVAEYVAYAFAWRATEHVLSSEVVTVYGTDNAWEEQVYAGCPQCRLEEMHTRHDSLAETAWQQERLVQSRLLRDIVGDPLQPVEIRADWLTWNDGTVANLARTVAGNASRERMLVLADALEDAGCTSTDILKHCRQPDEHVHGCWVLDALLGRS
jgi:hypothetical protein